MSIAKQILDEVIRLCNENPSNVYKREDNAICSYTKGTCINGSVGCIVGQAILNLFPDYKARLEKIDNTCGGDAFSVIPRLFGKTNDLEALEKIVKIQQSQDCGLRWKKCKGSIVC